jgi:hypothetical protein
MSLEWGTVLVGQLEFYWQAHLRPRLVGLTDDEYLWEPVEDCWSIRRGADGTWAFEVSWPEPDPPPVTTIAWRLVHVSVGCFTTRTRAFFANADLPDDVTMFDPRLLPAEPPATAADALTSLDAAYRGWRDAVAGLDDAALARPLGPRGAQFADDPMAELVAHVNREVMHHGGEICLLRDLYRATRGHALG